MPIESPLPLSSTAGASREEQLGSAHGERPQVVSRWLSDAESEPNRKTSPTQPGVETAAEAPRPRKRFPRLMPIIEAAREDFGLLEKWDGVVLATDADTFTARLYGANEPTRTTQAVFSKNELSPEERGQIQEGASFVWTIGYRHIGTTRHRDSVIYFRRLLPWEAQELDAAERRAAELKNTIGWR